MARRSVPYEVIRTFVKENPYLTNAEVGEQFKVSEATVRRATRDLVRTQALLGVEIPIEVPMIYELERGDIALAGDIHVPITKWSFFNRFLDDMKAEGIKRLGIPGDFWHADHPSSFDYKQSAADMDVEKKVGNEVMAALCEQFDEILFSWGNHDARYHKMLRYGVSFSDTMKMLFHDVPDHLLKKVRFSNLDHFRLEFAGGLKGEHIWYVCHPKSYSSIPLTQSRRIAAKELSNVITAHSHHHAVGHDVSGRFTCAEVGGFFDRERTEYLQRSTQFPNWQNGYAVVRQNNTLSMRGEKWTY